MSWTCPACALGVSVSPRATTRLLKTLTRILSEPSGQESYDAVIAIPHITAMIVRAKP